MPEYKDIPDSGQRRDFGTGSVRDVSENKPRPDLISVFMEDRLGMHYANGCKKYGMRNWELGQPSSEYYASCRRHLNAYMKGDRSEDHLAAAIWNLAGIIHNEELIDRKIYDKELHDLPDYSSRLAFDQNVRVPALLENDKRAQEKSKYDHLVTEMPPNCPIAKTCAHINEDAMTCDTCPGGHDGV